MATIRFNAFMFKALSNTYGQSIAASTRQFNAKPIGTKPAKPKAAKPKVVKAKKPKKPKVVKPKKPTKKDEKLKKLLKQYPDPTAPKRPMSSYLLFAEDYRNKNQSIQSLSPKNFGQVNKQIGAAWRGLADAQKSQYTQRFAADLKQYKAAKEQYTNSGKDKLWLDKLLKLSEEKPPNSGYQLFMKKRLPQIKERNPGTPQPQILSMAANEWSDLMAPQKKEWSEKAKRKYTEWENKLK